MDIGVSYGNLLRHRKQTYDHAERNFKWLFSVTRMKRTSELFSCAETNGLNMSSGSILLRALVPVQALFSYRANGSYILKSKNYTFESKTAVVIKKT